MFITRLLKFNVSCASTVNKISRFYGSGVCGSGSDKEGSSGSKGEDQEPSKGACQPAPMVYDCRKYGHNLPCDNVVPFFEPLPHFPTGIFRCTVGEVLGQGANKGCQYQNPEYFSFHHMSFYDMHMLLRCYRNPCPKTGRKK